MQCLAARTVADDRPDRKLQKCFAALLVYACAAVVDLEFETNHATGFTTSRTIPVSVNLMRIANKGLNRIAARGTCSPENPRRPSWTTSKASPFLLDKVLRLLNDPDRQYPAPRNA